MFKYKGNLKPSCLGFIKFVLSERKSRNKNAGQTTVELLLVLPMFFFFIFAIMEIGNIAFQVIVANHGVYEIARIGSLTAGPPDGNIGVATQRMNAVKSKMFPNPGRVSISARRQVTQTDPQLENHANADLIVTLKYKANLVFPITRYVLSKPLGSGTQTITVTARMPIESPAQ